MFIWNQKPMRNTDLVLYPTDNVGIPPKQKMKLFLFAGIAFVLVGITSILLIYMFMDWLIRMQFDRLSDAASLGLSAIILESCYCFYWSSINFPPEGIFFQGWRHRKPKPLKFAGISTVKACRFIAAVKGLLLKLRRYILSINYILFPRSMTA